MIAVCSDVVNHREGAVSISRFPLLGKLAADEKDKPDCTIYFDTVRVDIGLYPISRYNRRIDAGYLHFCPINITFTWVMNKTPRKMYKTKRPPMYKSAVIKSYIS